MSSDKNPRKIYYHPEALQKLYLPQVDSIDIVNLTVDRGQPVFLTTLQEADLQNDLAQRYGLGEISQKELEGVRLQLHKDKARGKLLPLDCDWNSVHNLAREFTQAALYNRSWQTMDLLHLATARFLGFGGFLTPDRALRGLAGELGFWVG
jgi:hypothetical protein